MKDYDVLTEMKMIHLTGEKITLKHFLRRKISAILQCITSELVSFKKSFTTSKIHCTKSARPMLLTTMKFKSRPASQNVSKYRARYRVSEVKISGR